MWVQTTKFTINRKGFGTHCGARIEPCRARPRRTADFFARRRLKRQRLQQHAHQRVHIIGLKMKPGAAIFQGFQSAAMGRRQGQPGARLGFHRDPAKGLWVERGGNHKIGFGVKSRHILHMAAKFYLFRQPGGGNLAAQFTGIAMTALVIPCQNQPRPAAALVQTRQRLDHQDLALPAGQPPRQNDHRLVRHGAACGGNVEKPRIDAAPDDADAGRVRTMLAGHVAGDEMRIGNHQVAAGHNRIIAPFQRAAGIIGAMVGGHKRDAEALCCGPPAPGRGARAGMDGLCAKGFGHGGDAPGIAPQGHGVFGGHWQISDLAAGGGKLGLQAATGGDGQRLSAIAHERARNVYDGALGAAGFKRRDDLHDFQGQTRLSRWFHVMHGRAVCIPVWLMANEVEFLQCPDGQRLACRVQTGTAPALLWLGGLRSDMDGTKAQAVSTWAHDHGRAMVRFDYSGHGLSPGRFEDGTISRWRDDALCVLDQLCPQGAIVTGSSMGGWIALLAALRRPEHVKALMLIAPAPDFTETLMWARFDEGTRRQIMERGATLLPADDGEEPLPVSRALIEDGRKHVLLDGTIGYNGPVRIHQGVQDQSVPWPTALELMARLHSADVQLNLVKNGDHRLSKPADLARLTHTIETLCHLCNLADQGRKPSP